VYQYTGDKLEQYGLGFNPFSRLVPESKVKFIIQRDGEIGKSLWALRPALEGVSTHVVVVGGYGNGKTHLLRYVSHFIGTHERQAVFPIYVNSPGENFRRLYSNMVLGIGKDKLEQVVWRYLATVAAELPEEFGLEGEDASRLRGEDPPVRKYVQVGKLLFPKLITKARDDMLKRIPLIDYSTALLNLVVEEHSFTAWKWLCGEDVPGEQRRDLGLSMSINSDERALRALLSLKEVLHLIGYKLIVILIDEFEIITTLHEFRRQQVLNEIRHLVDLAPSGLSVFLACAPDAWRSIVEQYHAFLDRFNRVVFLNPLTESQTRRLVEAYLGLARIPGNGHSRLHPFTPEALKVVSQYSLGNVRNTIRLCQAALDYGASNGGARLSRKAMEGVADSLQLEPVQSAG